jgi:hypothetical protein
MEEMVMARREPLAVHVLVSGFPRATLHFVPPEDVAFEPPQPSCARVPQIDAAALEELVCH